MLYFLVASVLLVIFYRFVPPPLTPLMLIRVVEQKWQGQPAKLTKDWNSIGQISPNMGAAVIASEDQNFHTHFGFDTESIRKAYQSNGRKKRVKGASTITQQVAKNVFLWPQRSYLRKAIEAYFTVLIEVFWPKKRILEVYLNIVELGNGIYGVEAASRNYYRQSSKELTQSQAALLAAVLPNPRKWNPVKPTSYILQRKQWILRNMKFTHKTTRMARKQG